MPLVLGGAVRTPRPAHEPGFWQEDLGQENGARNLPARNFPAPPVFFWFMAPMRGLRAVAAAQQRSGVALVATLIMLSLVTFMVVAFLGIARRERRSVEASLTQGDARVAMEYALHRAQGDLAARVLASGDKWNYGLMVPTNYQSGYAFNAGVANATNVNSATTSPTVASLLDFLQNLGNLQYDARVPVFSTNFTNVTLFAPLLSETNQGRYYLDFNENGIFEATDRFQSGDPHWLGVLATPGQRHGPNNPFVARYTYLMTPVGKTLDANLIHNQAKRTGVATEGYYRNLGLGPQDMNAAALLAELNPYWGYNYQLGAGVQSTFAPTARDPHRDALRLLLFRNNGSVNNFPSLATLFGGTPATTLVNEQFDVLGNGPLMNSTNLASPAADLTTTPWPGGTNTAATPQQLFDLNELLLTTRSYSATLTANLKFLGVTNEAASTPVGDRNRRTYYDLLSVLGVESAPLTNKLNLNWANNLAGSPGGETYAFTNWDAGTFFFSAAELMLRASCSPSVFVNNSWTGFSGTDPLVLATNWFFGGGFSFNYVNVYYTNNPAIVQQVWWPNYGFVYTNAGFMVETNRTNGGGISLSVTNIPLYPFSYYSGEVHRLLQFAANLYDATTAPTAAPAYPTLFRPHFAFQTNGWPSNDFVRIAGYTTNETDTALLGLPVYDLNDPDSRMAMYTNGTVAATGEGFHQLCLVSGTPVIIGAKKGYPNFNEFGAQTVFSVTRKLEFVKTNATNFAIGAVTQTNQSLIIALTNIYGLEAWNSYARRNPPLVPLPYPRDLQLDISLTSYVVLTNEFGPVYTNLTNYTVTTNIAANTWGGFSSFNPAPSFKGFFFTGIPVLAATPARGYAYATNFPALPGLTNGFLPASPTPTGPSAFGRSNGFPELKLGVVISNQLRYALSEPANNRVVDFVTLNNLTFGADLASALPLTNGTAADAAARFWYPTPYITNRSLFDRTLGISNQIALCLDTNVTALSTNQWRQWSLNTPVLREIDRFRRFLGLPTVTPVNQLPSPATTIQSPFNPTRVVVIAKSWEANDPLVHYTSRDLMDPFRPNSSDQTTPLPLPIGSLPSPGTVFQAGFGFVNGRFVGYTNGGLNFYYQPWGRSVDNNNPRFQNLASLPNYYTLASPAYDQRLKDAGIFNSDQWDFPQRKFANLGWIGRVHRGTPWQTFNLKSDSPNPTNWFYWAHSSDTSPTNDWRLVDIFTTAINAGATRSLLSVNQTNHAAWAAALGGTLVLSNNGPFIVAPTPASPNPVITPQTPQFASIVGDFTTGLINAKHRVPMWNVAASYSAGDVVSYAIGPYGGASNYVAVAGTNQSQNPFLQNSAGNYGYWTNVPFWNNTTIYSVNQLVVYAGVPYFALLPGSGNPSPPNPTYWQPYQSRSFNHVGKVLTTHQLSTLSPYLNIGQAWNGGAYAQGARVYWQGWYYQAMRATPLGVPPNPYLDMRSPYVRNNAIWLPLDIARNGGITDCISDVFVERIPQQTLGLLTLEPSPRVAIYAYGQSLKPAERGIYVGGAGAGAFSGMATNYQITGEFASRTVLRLEGLPEPGLLPRPLPAGAPPQFQPRVVIESHKFLPPR